MLTLSAAGRQLPPVAEVKSESLLRHLMQRPSAEDTWEVGGNCNILIAAARLGLQVASCGNLGDDIYGRFLRSILQVCRCPLPGSHPPLASATDFND